MPGRRSYRSVPVVLLHGLNGSGPEHWQTWLARTLAADGREVRYPSLPDQDSPSLDAWLSVLDETLHGLPPLGFDVIAHSLGAVLWLHHTVRAERGPAPDRVALVAPPAPDLNVPEAAGFFPPPLDVDAVRAAADGTVLVAGDDDPYLKAGIGATYGVALKLAATVVPGGGHLNTESGHGEWRAVLDWARRDNLAFLA